MLRFLFLLVCVLSFARFANGAQENVKDDDLLQLVIARAANLKNESVALESANAPHAKFVSADKSMLTVDIGGQAQPIPWKLISAKDVFGIAQVAAASADELMLVARYAHQVSQDTLAEKLLDKALKIDASRAKDIQALYESIKSAAPKTASAPATSGTTPTTSAKTIPAGPWQCLGPGGGGTIYTPTICPSDPKTAVVTCDMSGVYLTRDGGRHWRVLPGLRYGHGVAFGADASTIYVGAADKVHRSIDGGATWQGITADRQFPLCSGHVVTVDPEDPKSIWVAYGRGGEAGFKDYGGQKCVAERSVDGGGTFKDASKGLPDGAGLVKKIAIDPSSPVGNRTLFAATSNGFYRSRDAGQTWEKAGTGLPRPDLRDCVCMFDKSSKKCAVLAALEPPGGVYRSDDGGSSFVASGRGLSDKEDGAGLNIEQLAAGWSDPNIAYVAGPNCAVTLDGGKSWRKLYADATKGAGWLMTFFPWSHDGFRAVGCNPKNPKQVWFSGDMQLFTSEDAGASLTETNSHPYPEETPRYVFKEQHTKVPMKAPFYFDGGGLEVTYCYQVIPDPKRADVWYACYADIGSFRTEDGGKSWTYNEGIWNTGIKSEWRNSCYELAVDRRVPGHLYGAFSGFHNLPGADFAPGGHGIGGVAESSDGGKSWTPFEKSGLPELPCTSVLIDRKSGALYVAVYSSGVYRSTNGGKNFEAVNAGLPGSPLVWRLRQTPDNTIYLACTRGKPGGVWKFEEGKSAWSRVDKSPALADIRDLRVMESGGKENEKFLIAAVEGQDGGVYASSDGGETWKKVFATPVRSADRSPDGKTWVAGGEGLFHSLDGGANWAKMNDFPFGGIDDTTLNPRNPGEVWIGTSGCGVFKGSSQ